MAVCLCHTHEQDTTVYKLDNIASFVGFELRFIVRASVEYACRISDFLFIGKLAYKHILARWISKKNWDEHQKYTQTEPIFVGQILLHEEMIQNAEKIMFSHARFFSICSRYTRTVHKIRNSMRWYAEIWNSAFKRTTEDHNYPQIMQAFNRNN